MILYVPAREDNKVFIYQTRDPLVELNTRMVFVATHHTHSPPHPDKTKDSSSSSSKAV